MKVRKAIVALFVVLAFVSTAHAVTVTKKLQTNTHSLTGNSYGDGTYTGSVVGVGYCDKVRVMVRAKTTTGTANSKPYADLASTSTTTVFHRSASLGTVGARGTLFFRDATAANNIPYMRLALVYTTGFTGTTEIWCSYEDGSR